METKSKYCFGKTKVPWVIDYKCKGSVCFLENSGNRHALVYMQSNSLKLFLCSYTVKRYFSDHIIKIRDYQIVKMEVILIENILLTIVQHKYHIHLEDCQYSVTTLALTLNILCCIMVHNISIHKSICINIILYIYLWQFWFGNFFWILNKQ